MYWDEEKALQLLMIENLELWICDWVEKLESFSSQVMSIENCLKAFFIVCVMNIGKRYKNMLLKIKKN